jgi:hypothetical protein
VRRLTIGIRTERKAFLSELRLRGLGEAREVRSDFLAFIQLERRGCMAEDVNKTVLLLLTSLPLLFAVMTTFPSTVQTFPQLLPAFFDTPNSVVPAQRLPPGALPTR